MTINLTLLPLQSTPSVLSFLAGNPSDVSPFTSLAFYLKTPERITLVLVSSALRLGVVL